MNTKIYAYPLPIDQYFTTLTLPKGAKVVDLDCNMMKGGMPTLWVQVDTDEKQQEQLVLCRFDVGQEIPHNMGELSLIGRTLGLGKSQNSDPGKATPRNTFWFRALGEAAKHYLDLIAALASLQ